MRYQLVDWLHDFQSEPVRIYSEIDDEEIRKIEIFCNGTIGYATTQVEVGDTGLSLVPMNETIDEINNNPNF